MGWHNLQPNTIHHEGHRDHEERIQLNLFYLRVLRALRGSNSMLAITRYH